VAGTDEDEKTHHPQGRRQREILGLAFKLMTDPFVGQLTFVRVYSGVLTKGDTVYNSVKGKKERIGRIVQMHANERVEVEEIRAGDIAACVGLKEVTTGETLCDVESPIVLERMVFPEPVIRRLWNPRPRPTRKKWVSLCNVWLQKILLSACVPTKSRARPSSPVWASCTWKSSWTA
jgi:elongation factor G